jgi:phosphatidylserine/phosphatidylglycerophosphate/cardiolipin synthase-like enzyme
VDGVYGSVGSFNLDYWSYRRNLEVSVSILDEEVARRIETRFLRDVELAGEVEYRTWSRRRYWRRLVHWLAYQVMRI